MVSTSTEYCFNCSVWPKVHCIQYEKYIKLLFVCPGHVWAIWEHHIFLQSTWNFKLHGLTLILTRICNYVYYNVWDKIIHPFPNFNGAIMEVWERISNSIPHFTGRVNTFPCWDLKFSHVSKMGLRLIHGMWSCILATYVVNTGAI